MSWPVKKMRGQHVELASKKNEIGQHVELASKKKKKKEKIVRSKTADE